MSDWAEWSATRLAAAIREKQVSSTELLEYFVDRYERLNPKINAIVTTNLEAARARAKQADEALSNGELWGPLHGLPMTLKDNFQVEGMPMANGAPQLKDFMPPENQDVAQLLIDAGAIVFGKTNLPLFGMDTQSFNEVYGQTNNPWDLSTTPGGSSGGTAAALAAGLTGLDIGNDIGGSIRIPAHFCGIYGHKPSFGIVSTGGGINALTGVDNLYRSPIDLVVHGPLARSAEDLKLAMDVLVSVPLHQRRAIHIELPEARESSLKDFRVGVWFSDNTYPVDSESSAVFDGFLSRLEKGGIKSFMDKPDIDLEASHDLRNLFEMTGLSHVQPPDVLEQYEKLQKSDDEKERALGEGFFMSHRDWLLLEIERTQLRKKWDDYFRDVDVLICPVARIPAHPHDHTPIFERSYDFDGETEPYWQVMGPWNSMALTAYLPATVAPIGRTSSGLPVGVQIIGPYLEDMTPIQFAIELEREMLGSYELPPGFECVPSPGS